ncbi:hypothetical protein [Pseudoclavibacter soli]|uniref:hypothetical protein n=1 Tax=Pseudoclavibacter soli TaxID=452623 RepID=UPI0003FD0BB7|nr:hypothetical protein [Pseudoclavibacter soli]
MSTFDPTQHPRGNSVTGHAGQFATKQQTSADVTLETPAVRFAPNHTDVKAAQLLAWQTRRNAAIVNWADNARRIIAEHPAAESIRVHMGELNDISAFADVLDGDGNEIAEDVYLNIREFDFDDLEAFDILDRDSSTVDLAQLSRLDAAAQYALNPVNRAFHAQAEATKRDLQNFTGKLRETYPGAASVGITADLDGSDYVRIKDVRGANDEVIGTFDETSEFTYQWDEMFDAREQSISGAGYKVRPTDDGGVVVELPASA